VSVRLALQSLCPGERNSWYPLNKSQDLYESYGEDKTLPVVKRTHIPGRAAHFVVTTDRSIAAPRALKFAPVYKFLYQTESVTF